MTLWLNIVFAWIALILGFLLIVIWGLRLLNKKKKIPVLQKINRTLRKHHKWVGLSLIATALVHGLLSSDELLSINWGTTNLIVAILLGLSWMLRKKLNLKKWWMQIHRVLTVVFVGIFVIHILNVGGFVLDDMIAGRLKPPASLPEQTELQYANTSEEDNLAQLPSNAPSLSPTTQVPDITESPVLAAVDTSAPEQPIPDESTVPSTYIDGTYQGTGTGYGPDLVVEVVIENDAITSITVIEHNEQKEKFWGVPVELIPERIIEAQCCDVDIVSGATRTSDGIIDAVNDALNKALRT
ncbi:MAG: FMN-binding protein [Clostridia bacterium]|jgi:uncharacterized protein with FMN-binding domain|nr:FMN-binding protein [Clostridia bacterium]MBT7121472.1 FMN-binding protein [Clostridia bacterium]